MHRLAHPEGEVGTSKACAAMNVAMGLSAYSNDSLEDVVKQGEGKTNPYAMQVSILKSRPLAINMLKRAESRSHVCSAPPLMLTSALESGFKAILLTVDAPMLGRRLNEFRNSFCMPPGTTYPNIAPDMDMSNLEGGNDDLAYGMV